METNSTFLGVHFVLFGFNPTNEHQLRSKLVDGGGVDVGQLTQDCTHVVVDKIVYDDPICVAARDHGKTLVTGLWVDHSFDTEMLVDANSIIYRPPRDLNGIPGAKDLIMCLTGYQRQDRDDIMTMVTLMGAQFSKPLVANKVTHLICYKFEGEKYELAKKLKRIKIVNHRWLQECLRDWELLPEANYDKSGYELETLEAKAEAKDSEEEADDGNVKQFGSRNVNRSPHTSPVGMTGCKLKSVAPKIPSHSNEHEDVSHAFNVNMSSTHGKEGMLHQVLSFDNVNVPGTHACLGTGAYRDVSAVELPDQLNRTPNFKKVEKDLASTSRCTKGSPESDAKFGVISYSRKTPGKSPLPLTSGQLPSSIGASFEANLGVEHTKGVRTPQKGSNSCQEKETSSVLPHKRVADVSDSSPKSQRISSNAKAFTLESPSAVFRSEGTEATSLVDSLLETDERFPPGNDIHCMNQTANLNAGHKLPSSISMINCSSSNKKLTPEKPLFKTAMLGSGQLGNAGRSPQTSPRDLRDSTLASKTDIGDLEIGAHVVDEAMHLQNQLQDVEVSLPNDMEIEAENGQRPINSDSPQGKNDKLISKPLGRKVVGKKTLGSRPKLSATNQKGSIYLWKSLSKNDSAICSNGEANGADNEKAISAKMLETPRSTVNAEAAKAVDTETPTKFGDDTVNNTEFVDDETKAPEEKAEFDIENKLNEEKAAEAETTHEAETKIRKKFGGQNVDNYEANADDDAVAAKEGMSGTKLDNAVSSNKSDSDETNLKGNGAKGKVNKGRKQSSNKAKTKTVPASREVMKSKKNVNGKGTKKTKCNEKKVMEEGKGLQHSMEKNNSALSANKLENPMEAEKENQPVVDGDQNLSLDKQHVGKSIVKSTTVPMKINKRSETINSNSSPVGEVVNKVKNERVWFILSGHQLHRKEMQQVIRRLKGSFCRDSHQWSYQATHFIAPDPIRRTEKFFAAAASGRWILKTDYLSACSEAGKFLAEEPYEWHKKGLTEDGAINLEASRKWRLLRERTGHGAFYGVRLIVYGECIAPPLDTLKRAVKAGDGTILATSPPYTRFLKSGIDFAIVSPGMPHVDIWVQEFLKHEIPCVTADYLVEYVCKPGYSLERHVLYNTRAWAEKSFANMQSRAEEIISMEILTPPDHSESNDIPCQVCGSRDRGEVMLICGDESGSVGCGVGTHIDCCDPPLAAVPEEDWFCPDCSSSSGINSSNKKRKKGASVLKSK